MRSPTYFAVASLLGVALLASLILISDHADSSQPVSSRRRLQAIVDQYVPASTEAYIRDNQDILGATSTKTTHKAPDGCMIYGAENLPIHFDLQAYVSELDAFTEKVNSFEKVEDVRSQFNDDYSNREEVCAKVDIFDGNDAMKLKLSTMANSEVIEPLLPPYRHPKYCFTPHMDEITNTDYMIHDFGAMCRKLKKTSKAVLIDMGASVHFHQSEGGHNPALFLSNLYEKFGIQFDHIYAYEIVQKDAAEVYKLLPDSMQASYHWINMGVDPEIGSNANPFTMLLNKFDEDDLVVVKLDIDTTDVAIPFVQQIYEDERLQKLIDHFYFEDDRLFTNGAGNFYLALNKDVFDVFYHLRELGVAAHPWI